MRTYIFELDGKPDAAFRARDDADAAEIATSFAKWLGDTTGKQPGKGTSRPATIPEQARWREASVQATIDGDEEAAELLIPLTDGSFTARWPFG